MRFAFFGVVLCVTLQFCSCIKRSEQQRQQEQWHELEARLYDVPLVVNAIPVTHAINENTLTFSYRTRMPLQRLERFYKTGMEGYGWQMLWAATGQEQLLLFEKPRRFCTITMRPHTSGTLVHCWVGFKNELSP